MWNYAAAHPYLFAGLCALVLVLGDSFWCNLLKTIILFRKKEKH
jgi:hypothetical protein